MIQGSLRCFVYGLLSFLPGIGLPFAVLSLWHAGRVRVRERQRWNVARDYRMWGVAFVVCGVLIWIFAAAILAYNAISNRDGNDGWYGGGGD